jgi:CheY-like chemotaxis protein
MMRVQPRTELGEDAGAVDYLVKPFSLAELAAREHPRQPGSDLHCACSRLCLQSATASAIVLSDVATMPPS